MIDNYRKVENNYIENFSRKQEKDNHIIFWDERLPDMYAFNCTVIKDNIDINRLTEFVKSELKSAKAKKKEFLKIIIPPTISIEELTIKELSNVGFEVTTNLYMKVEPSKHINFKVNESCIVKVANTEDALEDGKNLDIEASTALGMPVEFAKRKASRKKEVFSDKNKNLYSYICYYDNKTIGKCELHVNEEYGKIEDFDVLEDYREQGFGTTILKKIISDCIDLGVNRVYLITDKDDTPKEMYSKLGFEIIGEEVELLWIKK